jgi:hypothetical protein
MLDLTGKTFNRLSVIRFDHINKSHSYWLCKCICGNEKIIEGYNLTHSKTKSCGCIRKELIRNKCAIDITGQKFGRLTVVNYSHSDSRGSIWLCKCDCKKDCLITYRNLKTGKTKSCGCLRDEMIRQPKFYRRKSVEEKKITGRICCQKRRARINNTLNTLTKSDIRFLEIFQNFKCASCGKDITGNYHIDHIYPVSKGGGLTLRNVQLLCPHCNVTKHTETVDYIGYYMFTGEFANAQY